MNDIKTLVEFLVAVVSAYFLMRIEIVKLQKDIAILQRRVEKSESKIEYQEENMQAVLKEIKDVLHKLQIQIIEIKPPRRHE